MVATVERTKKQVEVPPPEEDGYPVRTINGVGYSTKPYPDGGVGTPDYDPTGDERPLYWNPLYPGQEMTWRSEERDKRGYFPIIQRERWEDPHLGPGIFRPRNPWEREMTRNWMTQTLEGCHDPERWSGINHPAGAHAQWRCECTWPCGNYAAFEAHLRYLRHKEARDHY